MEIPLWLTIVGIVFLVLMSAYYSATETAFASLNKYKHAVLAKEGHRSSKAILWLYEHFETTLVSVLVGNNLFNIALSTLSTFLFVKLFSSFLSDYVISILVSVVAALVLYVFGETAPKIVAKRNPDLIAKLTCYPMVFFVIIFYPLTMVFRGLSFVAKKVFRSSDPSEITEEDFTNVVEDIEKKGMLEANESDIIQATFEFSDTSVKEVLTPRNRMFMIDAEGLTKDKLLEILKKTDYSRIPVYRGNKDNIIGVLIVKNYLNAYFKNPNASFFGSLQKPYIVSPRIMIDNLIEGMRDRKTQIAIVKYDGKTVGMVTTEDILEELVGKINEKTEVEAQ